MSKRPGLGIGGWGLGIARLRSPAKTPDALPPSAEAKTLAFLAGRPGQQPATGAAPAPQSPAAAPPDPRSPIPDPCPEGTRPIPNALRLLAALLTGLPLLALYAATRAPTVTTAFGGADGGELAAAALSAGVPHPPGSPFYLIWSRVMLLLPAGEPAARLALGGGVAAALAAAVLALLLLELPSAAPPRLRASLAIGAGWLLGLDPALWRQAVVAEVYALALLLLALALWLAARWQRWRRRLTLLAGGLALGLGLGVQLPVLALGLGSGALVAWQLIGGERGRRATARQLGLMALGAAAGALAYAILPILGQRHPAASWGDWASLAGAWRHVSAAEYGYLAGAVPWQQWPGRIGYALRELAGGLGPWGLALAALGLASGAAWLRPWRWLSGGLALGALGWAVSYGGADSTSYLLPLHLLGALWAGIGGLGLAERVESWGLGTGDRGLRAGHSPASDSPAAGERGRCGGASAGEQGSNSVDRGEKSRAGGEPLPAGRIGWRAAARIGLLVAPLLLLALVPGRIDQLSLRGATGDRELAGRRLGAAPPDAVLLTARDEETFPLWYLQAAEGARPDALPLDGRLWAQPWYRRRLPCAGGEPDLALALRRCGRPVAATPSAAALLPGWSAAPLPGADLLALEQR